MLIHKSNALLLVLVQSVTVKPKEMNSNAPLMLLGLTTLSLVLRRAEAGACAVHTYKNKFTHWNGEFNEICDGEVSTCKGGCSASLEYKMHLPTSQDVTQHCNFAVDCCQTASQITTGPATKIDLVNCQPLQSGEISKGPFIDAIVKNQAATCHCMDDFMQGGTTTECAELHGKL